MSHDAKPTCAGWMIEPVGSNDTGWALVHDGVIKATHPSAFVLGADLDAKLKGADSREALARREGDCQAWLATAQGAHGSVRAGRRAAAVRAIVQALMTKEAEKALTVADAMIRKRLKGRRVLHLLLAVDKDIAFVIRSNAAVKKGIPIPDRLKARKEDMGIGVATIAFLDEFEKWERANPCPK